MMRWLAGATLMVAGVPSAMATGAPVSAPQVLIAITNSESMDGTTSGAIMVGSGALGSSDSSLNSSSSPVNYTVPSGFVPPLGTNGDGTAKYTVGCSSYQCDNSPSRLNMAKAAITNMLSTYGTSLNFGLYTYSTGSPSKYTTWVYYMSPANTNFTFTNTPSATTVANPCYNYSSGSSTVKSNCGSIAALYSNGVVSNNQYINIGTTSDDALVNDVLYSTLNTSVFTTYGNRTPSDPYSTYSLSTYTGNIGNFKVSYASTAPTVGGGGFTTTPTNAGYVPFSPQVMYAKRGWGYGASQSATTGAAAVAMSTDPASSAFTGALSPETNNASSTEIKSVAGQSAIYGLMNGAKSYLATQTLVSCQKQYVILMTDGLPTMDSGGHAWPPLGTTTANAYSLNATYGGDGSFTSSNSQAVTDAVNAIKALNTAGIKVFVIGLGAGVDPSVNDAAADLLTAMAIAGGTTNYYAATDSTSLNNALNAIVDIIYNESAIAAPVAPISVSSGSSYEYKLSTITVPATGYVKAYPVAASGVPNTSASWDAGTVMTTAQRQTKLMVPTSDGSGMASLDGVDAAAYHLVSPTACVPDVAKIYNYVWNPGYTYNSCSYLNGRNATTPSLIGTFSTQNTGKWVGPPGSAQLTAKFSSYITYARGLTSRTPQLLFSNADGFIYGVDASSGALQWGWTTRNVLSKLQYYSTFLTSGYTDGGFTVVDAMDAGGSWGTYLVGSFQSGAEHFSVKLDGTLKPASMVFDGVVTSGTAPGDKAGAIGSTPLRQPPVVVYINNASTHAAFYVYVVNVGTTSTLYEVNVATGASTSAVLPFTVTSALSLNANSNQLFAGTSGGDIWAITLASGTASADANFRQKIGTMVNPATGTALSNVLYVGYTDQDTQGFIYAMTASQLELFNVTIAGWTPLWASTPSAGYVYNQMTSAWASSNTVTRMTPSSVVSDMPLVIGNALLVPTFVAGAACTSGTGYYDFFDFGTGAFPSNTGLTVNGNALTGDMSLGSGAAFTTSVMIVTGGLMLNEGTQGSLPPDPNKNLKKSGNANAEPVSWRRSL